MKARETIHVRDNVDFLEARGESFRRELAQERQRMAQLESEIKEATDKIANMRETNKKKAVVLLNMHTATAKEAYQRADGIYPTRLAEANQKKLVKTLESRLEKALVRSNEIQHENTRIRNNIDVQRRKICHNEESRVLVEGKLKKMKLEIDDIMEKAAFHSQQREKVIERRNRVIKENNNEKKAFQREYQELETFISGQAELLGESITKVAKGVVARFKLLEGDSIQPALVDESKRVERKIQEVDEQCQAERQSLLQTEVKIEAFEKNFKKLQEVSGFDSPNDIISVFVKNEEESYSLFNHIQEINQETEMTLQQVARLQEETNEYTKDRQERHEQRVSVLNENNRRLTEAKEERQKMTDTSEKLKETVGEIAKRIDALDEMLKRDDDRDSDCENDESSYGGGPREDKEKDGLMRNEIGGGNALETMEVIEKKSVKIISEYACQRGYPNPVKSTQQPNKAFSRPQVDMDMDIYDISDDDDVGVPVSLIEVRRQAAEKMGHT